MKNWEDILRNRLRSYRGPDVPEQEESMWNSIEEALDKAVPQTPSKPWMTSVRRFSIAAVTLAAVGLAWVGMQESSPPSANAPVTHHPTEKAQNQEGANAIETHPVSPDINTTADEATSPTESENSPQPSNPPATDFEQDAYAASMETATTERTHQEDKARPTAEGHLPETTATHLAIDPMAAEVNPGGSTAKNAVSNGTEPPFGSSPEGPSNSADMAAFQPPLVAFSTPPPSLAESTITPDHPRGSAALPMRSRHLLNRTASAPALLGTTAPINKRKPIGIRAFTGPTRSRFSLIDDPANSHFFQADFSAGGGLMLEFNGAHCWSIGLAWNDYVHRLQFTEISETQIFAMGVVSITIDTNTGDTLSIEEGLITGNEERTRSVNHHNRFRAFSVPIEWQKVKGIGRWQVGLGLGASLQIRSGAYGSILNPEGQIIRYADNNLSRSRFSVVPTVRAFSGLRFAPAWRLDIGVATGIQRHKSRPAGYSPTPDIATTWKGQLVNTQLQLGLTRFLSRKRNPMSD